MNGLRRSVSNVYLQMSSHDLAKLHWLHLFDFSPLCVFKCLLKFFYSTTLNGPIATLCLRLFGLCDRLERGSVIYVWLAPTLSCNSRIKLESNFKIALTRFLFVYFLLLISIFLSNCSFSLHIFLHISILFLLLIYIFTLQHPNIIKPILCLGPLWALCAFKTCQCMLPSGRPCKT